MIRVVDYLVNYIYKLGVKEIFMLTGGGMIFLSDAIAKHPKLKAVCCHHEQAAAMAAVAYAKYNGNLGVTFVTTGCGGTNAITGLLHAWQDSVPCLFISGQCKREETIRNSGLKLRQFGVQEVDIISLVNSLTKYAVMINEPQEIAYHLKKAIYLAKSGRPGPVWLDIPLDVQGAKIKEKELISFKEEEIIKNYKEKPTNQEIQIVSKLLNQAKRPVIIAGGGIKLAKAVNEFNDFLKKTQIPTVASRLGVGLIPTNNPLYIGCIGNKGTRAGNFAIQNADLVLVLGSRLSVSTTGHQYKTFAREAKIIVVDIDPEEHQKKTIKIDSLIIADVKNFLEKIKGKIKVAPLNWRKKCLHWKKKYPVCLPKYAQEKEGVNLYYFIEKLSQKLKKDSVVISDAGSTCYVLPQALKIKKGQRYIASGAQAEMGFTLPATIGVSFARGKKEVIGITGDGSFQLNLQELQTIVYHHLPIKLFVWNNNGYLSIRATQKKFCEGRLIGTDPSSGISFPSLKKIAQAYGIKYFKVAKSSQLEKIIKKVLRYKKAVICEVICPPNQEIIPTVNSYQKPNGTIISKPLEDMYPFLPREEFKKEMIIKTIEE